MTKNEKAEAVRKAAEAYLASYEAKHADAETWFLAVSEKRNALRSALALPEDEAPVERARAAFALSGSAWARHQFECPGAQFEGPGAEWFIEEDALRVKAIHDHDALLAAERAERGGAS